MMVHNNVEPSPGSMTLALQFGVNHLYLVGPRQAPLWIRRRGLFERRATVVFHRVDGAPGHWWTAQHGSDVVILGQGVRPALILEKEGGQWLGLLPAGRHSTRVKVPDASPVTVRPVTTVNPDRRSTLRAD
ncbi:hypothetical protein [Sulfobacillus harzensis]|uniref:Uncharacterized protein n=1 Tax=Sulfobacillus harzensis TaxID=2729629 RepID=A0A7Y0L0X3_9FIRM|nr:hypothetical protein [Sulfobacillus harzensis]NMP21276.1 hypothetical protein [Sulfobacillus harzensis]